MGVVKFFLEFPISFVYSEILITYAVVNAVRSVYSLLPCVGVAL